MSGEASLDVIVPDPVMPATALIERGKAGTAVPLHERATVSGVSVDIGALVTTVAIAVCTPSDDGVQTIGKLHEFCALMIPLQAVAVGLLNGVVGKNVIPFTAIGELTLVFVIVMVISDGSLWVPVCISPKSMKLGVTDTVGGLMLGDPFGLPPVVTE
jgi:hypothetical protein